MSEEPYTNNIDLIFMANLLECSLLIDEYKGGIWRRTVIKPMEEIAEKIRIPLIVVKNHVDGYRDSEMVTMKMNTSSGFTNCLSRRLRYRKGRLMAKGKGEFYGGCFDGFWLRRLSLFFAQIQKERKVKRKKNTF